VKTRPATKEKKIQEVQDVEKSREELFLLALKARALNFT
jgi:hypothetical protein